MYINVSNNFRPKMKEHIEKVIYIITEILRNDNDVSSVEIMENSTFIFEESYNRFTLGSYTLNLKVLPNIYTKQYSHIERLRGLIQHYGMNSSDIVFTEINIKPDYDKISFLNSEVTIIETKWDEINILQKKLIENMRASNSSIDFQNVGNTSRTIMDKLARLVFDPKIHIAPKGVETKNGMFKNQFHTYISSVLNGGKNKELRLFAQSAVDFTENAIDLMNKTTHKLDVQKHFAEVCVISTISVINLIKAVNEI